MTKRPNGTLTTSGYNANGYTFIKLELAGLEIDAAIINSFTVWIHSGNESSFEFIIDLRIIPAPAPAPVLITINSVISFPPYQSASLISI